VCAYAAERLYRSLAAHGFRVSVLFSGEDYGTATIAIAMRTTSSTHRGERNRSNVCPNTSAISALRTWNCSLLASPFYPKLTRRDSVGTTQQIFDCTQSRFLRDP